MSPNRKKLMAKIHIGKTQLKMDEETYRAFLRYTVGKASCKTMNEMELQQVLQALMAKGFSPVATRFKRQQRPQPAESKALYLKKITALLTNQGKPTTYADALAKQAFKVEFVHWLEVWQLKKIIQMLAVYERRHQE